MTHRSWEEPLNFALPTDGGGGSLTLGSGSCHGGVTEPRWHLGSRRTRFELAPPVPRTRCAPRAPQGLTARDRGPSGTLLTTYPQVRPMIDASAAVLRGGIDAKEAPPHTGKGL